ncbi:hypothetical protein PCO31111_05093 [Pandoraea communis]|uniref:DNA-binding protein n=1 Tax=Pandoraea communis TaxID=2508297 RepID=A0A5E4Z4R7_9BURK|nr:hypothetical protein [Pandoraea communis]VVE56089.1 hypothetical protein PCO31111_05093 [Pandoraea communis]
MPIVSISEAARLVGKNRKTVQKYLTDGQLSLSMDGQAKGIEISELIRVFGPLTGQPTLSMDRQNGQQVAPPAVHGQSSEIEGLKGIIAAKDAHIAALAVQVDELREEKRELRAQVTGLLEHRQQAQPQQAPTISDKIDKTGLYSLIIVLLVASAVLWIIMLTSRGG